MSHDDLVRALDTVHQELSSTEHLDPAEVARLKATMEEIQAALEAQPKEESALSHRISESARQFEESHPQLTSTLGRIADMLQQMGF